MLVSLSILSCTLEKQRMVLFLGLSALWQIQRGITSYPVVNKEADHEVDLEAQHAQEGVEGSHVVLCDALARPGAVVVDVENALSAVLAVPGLHGTLYRALSTGHCTGLGRCGRDLWYYCGGGDGVDMRALAVTRRIRAFVLGGQ